MKRLIDLVLQGWRDPRVLVVGVALLAGLLAAWGARHHLMSVTRSLEAQARVPTRATLVAAHDLAAGTPLDSERLAVRDVPEPWLSAEALVPSDYSAIEHATLQHPLRAGEPLLWAHVVAPPERFSSQLAAGRRAVTIPVDDINSVSGMVQPGDRIDLYVTFTSRGERITAPLLQRMKVLATGRQTDDDPLSLSSPDRFATVTLEASPEEAVKLIAARQQGTISAMLRHDADELSVSGVAQGDLATLLGLATDDAPPPPDRTIPVLFGDRNPASIPALDGSDAAAWAAAQWLDRASAPALSPYLEDDASGARSLVQGAISERSMPGLAGGSVAGEPLPRAVSP